MADKVRHEIKVGTMEQTWDQDVVKASLIMEKANFTPTTGFVLEALDGPHGDVAQEFQPTDDVDLREKDRKFFSVTPGGSGRS